MIDLEKFYKDLDWIPMEQLNHYTIEEITERAIIAEKMVKLMTDVYALETIGTPHEQTAEELISCFMRKARGKE